MSANTQRYQGNYVTAFDTVAGDTTFTSADQVIDIAKIRDFSFGIEATSLDAADSLIVVQESVDNTNWLDMVTGGATVQIVLSTGTSSNIVKVVGLQTRSIRLRFEANSVTSGTITITTHLKAY